MATTTKKPNTLDTTYSSAALGSQQRSSDLLSAASKMVAPTASNPTTAGKKRVTMDGMRFSVPADANEEVIKMTAANIKSKNPDGGKATYTDAQMAEAAKSGAAPQVEGAIPEGGVNTGQPVPGSTQIQAPGAIGPTQLGGGFAGMPSGSPTTPLDTAERYKQGLAQVQGTQAPATQGQAGMAIRQAVPSPTQDMSHVDTLLQEDQGFNDLQSMYKDYFHPQKQKESLVSEYKKLYKNSGLDELDEEIMDAKTIIEGTEDDIRNEVQAAGGFGTDSQVQALASSRNKVLLKNYNNLVAMRETKQQNFDTMMNLSMKDREYADQKAEQMLNFQFKVMDYKDKFVANTRSQMNAIADKLGYQALYSAYSKDPRQLAFAEQILGVGKGGLQNLAAQPDLNRQLKEEQILTERAQRSNIYSQISERSNATNPYGTISGKAQNATQSAANSYANRMNESDVTLATLGKNFTGKFAIGGSLPNVMQSGDRQAYEQAKKNFATAILRRESGAQIPPSEFADVEKVYFPRAGDSEKVLLQKEQSRNTAINNFYNEADVNRPVLPGMVISANGKRYKVGVDGETLTEI